MLATVDLRIETRTPRPYQLEAVKFLRGKRRAFLTDQYGLGKTSEAIWAAQPPVLVAAPVHLLNHWAREIAACLPGTPVLVASGQGFKTRMKQLDGNADFYVINTELLRTKPMEWFEPLRAGNIQTFVVDEAHRLRGRTSQQTQGARAIANAVPNLYFLTASPVYNTPADLYSLLNMIDPKRFTSYWYFLRDYLTVSQTPWGPKILGLSKDRRLLGVFKEYAMGRTREEVKAQLPALQQSLVEVEPPQDWYRQYEKLKYTYRDKYDKQLETKQSVLQALRGSTQQPKLQAVCQLIQDNDCADHTLIYTYHKDLARVVGHLLKAAVITGDMPPLDREKVAKANDFVVATFPSVAEGLDFSHMRNVVFMEHDWQAGLIDQAMNRVHRPGNKHAHTNVYHVVVKRTVDAVLYRTLRGRSMTMDEVVAAALVPFSSGNSDTSSDNDQE